MHNNVVTVMEILGQALAEKKIAYMIFGGQAAKRHGMTRPTEDIDVTVGLTKPDMPRLHDLLKELGWTITFENLGALGGRAPVLWSYDAKHAVKIDFALTFMAYQREALARVHYFPVGRASMPFAAPEDVIVHALYRATPRDMTDCREILFKNPTIDPAVVRRGLESFEEIAPKSSLERWESLLSELRLGPAENDISEERK